MPNRQWAAWIGAGVLVGGTIVSATLYIDNQGDEPVNALAAVSQKVDDMAAASISTADTLGAHGARLSLAEVKVAQVEERGIATMQTSTENRRRIGVLERDVSNFARTQSGLASDVKNNTRALERLENGQRQIIEILTGRPPVPDGRNR